nr:PREDICTED: uncharacterized protein LOC105673010 [Linepithema humile]
MPYVNFCIVPQASQEDRLHSFKSYSDVAMFHYTVPKEVEQATWQFAAFMDNPICQPRKVYIHLKFGSYPIISTNNRTFLTNMYVTHDDSIIVTATTIYEQNNATIVPIYGPQSGDWFVAAYMSYWNERIQQQGFGHKCQYSIGTIALWSQKDNIESISVGYKMILRTSARESYYKIYIPSGIWNFRLSVWNCTFVLHNLYDIRKPCIEAISLKGRILPIFNYSHPMEFKNLTTNASYTFTEFSPYEDSYYYLLIVSSSVIEFNVKVQVSECPIRLTNKSFMRESTDTALSLNSARELNINEYKWYYKGNNISRSYNKIFYRRNEEHETDNSCMPRHQLVRVKHAETFSATYLLQEKEWLSSRLVLIGSIPVMTQFDILPLIDIGGTLDVSVHLEIDKFQKWNTRALRKTRPVLRVRGTIVLCVKASTRRINTLRVTVCCVVRVILFVIVDKIVNVMNPSACSIAQLKEFLRERNLPTTDNKTDLILRLKENDPGMWEDERQDTSAEGPQDLDDVTNAEMQRSVTREEDSVVNREFELIRRERDLLRRELELVRREVELRADTSVASVRSPVISESGTNNVKGLKDLLNEFELWSLAGCCLHARSNTRTLCSLGRAIALVTALEKRHVTVIDGVPDPWLRDQARLQRFKDAADLVEAFENVTLRSQMKTERNSVGTSQQRPKKETKLATSERTELNLTSRGLRCFNCKEKGHRMANCTKPRGATNKVVDDRASDSAEESSKASVEMNLTQPSVGIEPFTVPVSYTVLHNKGNTDLFSCTVIIDTRSPISLIKPDYVPVNCRTPVAKDDFRFNGINDSNRNIRIQFFVVPDRTINGTALLGRDFTSDPAVKVVIEQTLKILQNQTDSSKNANDFIDQIMHIDCADRLFDGLDLNIDTTTRLDLTIDKPMIMV